MARNVVDAPDTPLGRVTNGSTGAPSNRLQAEGRGFYEKYAQANLDTPYRFARPADGMNPREVDRRGHARDSGVSNKRSTQTGANPDVGGR